MKKAIIILLFLSSAITLFAQERKNTELPEILKLIGILDNSLGWIKNPEGQWISRKNRIPNYLSNINASLLDYEESGTGLDNFVYLKLYTVEIEGIEYYLLLKVTKGGWYKYDSIHKGWIDNFHYYYFIIEKNEFDKFKMIMDSIYLNKIKVKQIGNIVVFDLIPENKLSSILGGDIIKNIKNQKEYKYYLLFNTMHYKENNVIRFLIISEEIYGSSTSSFYGTISGGGFFNKIPSGKEIFIKPEVFDRFYYEVSLNDFIKLIKVSIN